MKIIFLYELNQFRDIRSKLLRVSASSNVSSLPDRTRRSRFTTEGSRVGLKPEKGWARRNYRYLSDSLLPALVRKREKRSCDLPPHFPNVGAGQVEICWIGHASFLIRKPGFNTLIDPVWAKWVGPIKRNREPGIQLDHLPKIDLILITHAHFDHLCMRTLKRLVDGTQTLVVPESVGKVVRRLNVAEVIEMSEWDSFEFAGTPIHFTPAHHWGARFIHDTHRGFGGYVIENRGHHIFHAGDSAYFDGFAEIGERFQIDTALIPIGAYDCPSGREVHMNPEEAVQAFLDTGAERMIPMHYATFPISNEKLCEPLKRLEAAVAEHQLDHRMIAPAEGELLFFE